VFVFCLAETDDILARHVPRHHSISATHKVHRPNFSIQINDKQYNNLDPNIKIFLLLLSSVDSQVVAIKEYQWAFKKYIIGIFFVVALRPKAGHDLLILRVSRSHTTTQHNR
jgi:hypothetical protein